MLTLLVVLTVLEIALAAGVLVVYLLLIRASLRRTARTLARVSFGVRAIEQQVAGIPAEVVRVNRSLEALAGALPRLAERAERRAS
jgi:uncharacterized protein YoxC